MDRLNHMADYFNKKERNRLVSLSNQNKNGFPEMSFDEIRLSCLENNGYESPELNDKIYLHFRGFKRIENLNKFTACKSIWLESNGFEKIENLAHMSELRCLYLSKNLVTRIEGLDALANLTILDLSYNRLSRLSDLSCCPSLQTLNVSHNALTTAESIRHLESCNSLQNIDLTSNQLEAKEEVLEVFQKIPELLSLSVNGNEVTKLPTFRKRSIATIPKMGYLDRPIDAQERLFATAFVEGGSEAETAAREKWKAELAEKRVREQEEYRAWQKAQAEIRKEAMAQGRSLITEFTPEEQETRRQEAKKAAEDEKAMLDLGVGKLGARYWQLEGKGGDALEEATKQLLAEEQRKKEMEIRWKEQEKEEKEEKEKEDSTVAEKEDDDDDDDDDEARVVELIDDVDVDDITLTLDTVDNAVSEPKTEPKPEPKPTLEEEEEEEEEPAAAAAAAAEEEDRYIGEDEDEDNNKAEEAALQILELTEENLRAARVADSFEIYKRQQKEARGGAMSSLQVPTSTWNSAPLGTQEPPPPRPLYWSETMDIELGKLVKLCAFDFQALTIKLQAMAQEDQLGNAAVQCDPSLLTSEECRKRWAQLDASQWSAGAPEVTALDTVFKICISPNLIGKGHGSQPDFQALSSMSAGFLPKYLKAPTVLPSVRLGEDPEDDEDGSVESKSDAGGYDLD